MIGRKLNSWLFPQEGRRIEHASNVLAFWQAIWGTGFGLIWLRVFWGTVIWTPDLGLLERKLSTVACYIARETRLQYCRKTSGRVRDYRLLSNRKGKNSLTGKLCMQAQRRRCILRKGLRGSKNLYQTGWRRSSPVWSPPVKTGRGGCFFLNVQISTKDHKEWKEKWNHGPIKGIVLISSQL